MLLKEAKMNTTDGKNASSFTRKADIYHRAMNEIACSKTDSTQKMQGLSRLIKQPLSYAQVIAYVQGRA